MIQVRTGPSCLGVRAGLFELALLVVAALCIIACSAAGNEHAAAAGAGGDATAGTPGLVGTGAGGVSAGASGAAGALPSQPADAKFSTIYGTIIVGSGCIAGPTCHASDAGGKLTMLEQGKAYTGLVGVQAMGVNMTAGGTNCSDTGLIRVKPGDPDNSLLIKKLEGSPPCGMPMPVGGMLKPEQILQIRTWIQSGANND
jgi:hypothetical protein